jgi:hypothetical protein
MKLVKFLPYLLLLFMAGCWGCLNLPWPVSTDSGIRVADCGIGHLGFLREGYTTKEEVIKELGEPKSSHSWPWNSMRYEIENEGIVYRLVLVFNENDVLKYYSCKRKANFCIF